MAVKSVDRAVQTDEQSSETANEQRNCLWVDRLYLVQVRLEFQTVDVVRRRRRAQLDNSSVPVRHACWSLVCCSASRASKDQVVDCRRELRVEWVRTGDGKQTPRGGRY